MQAIFHHALDSSQPRLTIFEGSGNLLSEGDLAVHLVGEAPFKYLHHLIIHYRTPFDVLWMIISVGAGEVVRFDDLLHFTLDAVYPSDPGSEPREVEFLLADDGIDFLADLVLHEGEAGHHLLPMRIDFGGFSHHWVVCQLLVGRR